MKTYQAVIVTTLILIILILLGLYFTKYRMNDSSTLLTDTQTGTTNAAAKADLIRVTSPSQSASVTSPLTITGEARGTWFFEASFPVVLTDWNGKIIAQGNAKATGDWMTADFVPFTAELSYSLGDISGSNGSSNRATLTLKRDNPSGLSENDDALNMTVFLH